MKCQLAGAGFMVFFWIIGAIVASAFEKEIGLYTDIILWSMVAFGIWFGYEVMQQCRKKSASPPPSS